jgi:DNA-binding transcriptional LysR family regulator
VVAGKGRAPVGEHPDESPVLWPVLAPLLRGYPDIKVELIVDYGLTDIVAERYDAGVRLGEQVARDMIGAPFMNLFHNHMPIIPANRRTGRALASRSAARCGIWRRGSEHAVRTGGWIVMSAGRTGTICANPMILNYPAAGC